MRDSLLFNCFQLTAQYYAAGLPRSTEVAKWLLIPWEPRELPQGRGHLSRFPVVRAQDRQWVY